MKDKQLRTVLNRHAARVARLKLPVRRNSLQAVIFATLNEAHVPQQLCVFWNYVGV